MTGYRHCLLNLSDRANQRIMKTATGIVFVLAALLTAGCGNRGSFDSASGTFIDSRDKQDYRWVRIGEQVWMAENLAWLPSVSAPDELTYGPNQYVYGYTGTQTTEAKAAPEYSGYGVLYSWEAARTACPRGWRLPTDEDWKALEMNLGMSRKDVDADYIWRQSGGVGKKLKAAADWDRKGNGTDSTGFAALPGGFRNDAGGFEYLGSFGFFWTATEGGALGAWGRSMMNTNEGVFRCGDNKRYGFSVRCIRE
jgi:uncharacterized protein (TIGR02145 family)